MSQFKPDIKVISSEEELIFTISGTQKYGLDKSIINGIRRTLLTDIPTIAFKTDDHLSEKDIEIVSNTTSLHNEMLLQRISLIPIYLNPDDYMKNYLFELKVTHTDKKPFQFVTTNDMNIYPLLPDIQKRIDNLDLEDEDNDFEELDNLLNSNNPANYDMNNPLNQSNKDKILRPFKFRGKKNYILISELKNTNSEDLKQEIHLFGSPSVSIGKENSRFQSVSCATSSFLKDEDLIETIFKERLELQNITDKDEIEVFRKRFMLSESEKYYHRDFENEPYRYNFKIKSCHYFNSSDLFKRAITILIDKMKNLKLSFIKLLQQGETSISSLKVNDFTYHYIINDEGHTLGNIIQSHIARRCINDKSILKLCGYKKSHPLEESIKLYVSVNPKHKIMKENEQNRFQKITSFIMDEIENIHQELKVLLEACDSL